MTSPYRVPYDIEQDLNWLERARHEAKLLTTGKFWSLNERMLGAIFLQLDRIANALEAMPSKPEAQRPGGG